MAKEDFKFYRINSQYIPQDPYASINPFKKVRDILMDMVAYHKLVRGERETGIGKRYNDQSSVKSSRKVPG
jgi:ABC-type dipeptide/oligopeptide/nickel transport system ATPase subunit